MDNSIYEVFLETGDEEQKGFFTRKSAVDPVKLVKSIATLSEAPCSMHLDSFPVDHNKFVVFIATKSNLFQYIGQLKSEEAGSFDQLFSPSSSSNAWNTSFPNESTDFYSILSLQIPVYSGNQLGTAKSLSWLNGHGIYHAPISMGSQSSGESVLYHPRLFYLEEMKSTPWTSLEMRNLVTLNFHHLVFGKKYIKAYSSLVFDEQEQEEGLHHQHDESSADIVLNQVWKQTMDQEIVGMAHDVIKGTIWVTTATELFELAIQDEDRDIWSHYLAKHKFEIAASYAKVP
jgi:hypothetical protein